MFGAQPTDGTPNLPCEDTNLYPADVWRRSTLWVGLIGSYVAAPRQERLTLHRSFSTILL